MACTADTNAQLQRELVVSEEALAKTREQGASSQEQLQRPPSRSDSNGSSIRPPRMVPPPPASAPGSASLCRMFYSLSLLCA